MYYLLWGLFLDSCVVLFWNSNNSDRQQKHGGEWKQDTHHISMSPSIPSADPERHYCFQNPDQSLLVLIFVSESLNVIGNKTG